MSNENYARPFPELDPPEQKSPTCLLPAPPPISAPHAITLPHTLPHTGSSVISNATSPARSPAAPCTIQFARLNCRTPRCCKVPALGRARARLVYQAGFSVAPPTTLHLPSHFSLSEPQSIRRTSRFVFGRNLSRCQNRSAGIQEEIPGPFTSFPSPTTFRNHRSATITSDHRRQPLRSLRKRRDFQVFVFLFSRPRSPFQSQTPSHSSGGYCMEE